MYILSADYQTDSIEEMKHRWKAYQTYLASIKEQLPKSVYEYATAPWHYNVGLHDPRCPHDAWVEAITVSETATRQDKQDRTIQIRARLLDPFHTGIIMLRYNNVVSFTLSAPNVKETLFPNAINRGHNDLIIDEIRLAEDGNVIHEIEFALGACWLIKAEGFDYQWIPFQQ